MRAVSLSFIRLSPVKKTAFVVEQVTKVSYHSENRAFPAFLTFSRPLHVELTVELFAFGWLVSFALFAVLI
jgi:hypothetical protein